MSIGKSIKRVDAFEKVTGTAQYADDFILKNALVAKVVHSTIANGKVKSINIQEALKVEGVVKILTCFDVPKTRFATAGHPYSLDPDHRDIEDRMLLNERVRYYGDDIAVIVAEDEISAVQAHDKIKVEYEEYEPLLTIEDAQKDGANVLHEDLYKTNTFAEFAYELGNYDEAIKEDGLQVFEGEYELPTQQHCHIENMVCYAYKDSKRTTIVSATQIPHIVRRIVSSVTGMPMGQIRVLKPFVGGGFGNKQDVHYEPLVAYLTNLLHGRCVKLHLTREETFVNTRVRHAMKIRIKSYVRPNGRFVAREIKILSNQGAYAAHGHAIAANAVTNFSHTYNAEKATKGDSYSVYTTMPVGAAMRAYGIPQITFAMEAHNETVINALHLDPIEFRKMNMMKLGFTDELTGMVCNSNNLEDCIEKGRKYIDWDRKRELYKNQTGDVRRGVGMAIFSYKTGVWPISLETAGCRIVLNQDGTAQVQIGATEIGQGSDTAFTQIASEFLGIPCEDINVLSTQDTDVTPFDTGAYASRQSYVAGGAVKQTALILRDKIIKHAELMKQCPKGNLDIKDGYIISKQTGERYFTVGEVSTHSLYNTDNSEYLTAESTYNCHNNAFSFGACFAEVEVDIPVGKVKLVDIINVHDSGTIINPQLAQMQIHGGMGMGIGYGMSEQMLFDKKTGKPLNNNLLDYKMPTTMDFPDLGADFAESYEISGPVGNKGIGEPALIPPAAAIRNAVLNATGVEFNAIPLTPQRLVEGFMAEGLIK